MPGGVARWRALKGDNRHRGHLAIVSQRATMPGPARIKPRFESYQGALFCLDERDRPGSGRAAPATDRADSFY